MATETPRDIANAGGTELRNGSRPGDRRVRLPRRRGRGRRGLGGLVRRILRLDARTGRVVTCEAEFSY